MNDIEYINRWEMLNKNFNSWYGAEDWNKQQKYLERSIGKEFSISKENIKKIFSTFNSIYSIPSSVNFSWEEYQFPTLVAITVKYVKKLR